MRSLLAALLLIIGVDASAAPRAEPEGVRPFLEWLYAGYRSGGDGRERASVFTPSTLELMSRAEASDPDGMGPVDADPICACQDFDDLTVEKIAIGGAEGRAVGATVRFRDRGMGAAPVTLRYELLRTDAGWRVHDVSLPEQGMLRSVLGEAEPAPAVSIVPVPDSGDIAIPRVRIFGSAVAERRINLVLDEVRSKAARERNLCRSGTAEGGAEFSLAARPVYNKDGLLSFRIAGFAFCGGAHGSELQDARSFDAASGEEIDPLALGGMSRASLAALGRGYYRGESACSDLLQSDGDAARLAHGFVTEEGLGLLYSFAVGAARSCGAEPAIIPWDALERHGGAARPGRSSRKAGVRTWRP